jgi:hypothetical protein
MTKTQVFTKTTVSTLNLIPLDKSFAVTGDGRSFYVSKKEWNNVINKEKDPFKAISKVRKYWLFSEEMINRIKVEKFYKGIIDTIHKESENFKLPKTEEEILDIESRLFCWQYSDHWVLPLDSETPVSVVMTQHYIGGITNDRFNLKKAESILRDWEMKGVVSHIEHVSIPYYNQSRGKDSAIEFCYQFSDNVLRSRLDALTGAKFLSVALKRVIPCGSADNELSDPFGLKSALLNEADLENQAEPEDA